MKKLTLEHLAPYFPYGLKGIVTDSSNNGSIETIIGLQGTEIITDFDCAEMDIFKPILRPLSDFEYGHISQIEDYLGLGQWCDNYDKYFDAWFNDAESIQKLVLQAPYEIIQFFFKNHFDVFGLIEQGLAIDINTLKNQHR